MAEQTAPAAAASVPRAILEDRFDRFMLKHDGVMTRRGVKLTGLLARAITATANRSDDRSEPGTGTIEDELIDLIRTHTVRRVDEMGLAR